MWRGGGGGREAGGRLNPIGVGVGGGEKVGFLTPNERRTVDGVAQTNVIGLLAQTRKTFRRVPCTPRGTFISVLVVLGTLHAFTSTETIAAVDKNSRRPSPAQPYR